MFCRFYIDVIEVLHVLVLPGTGSTGSTLISLKLWLYVCWR